MLHDADLLAAIPDHISLGSMLKATPSEEGGERILYIEASNEDVDHQNEVVLQKALAESAGYFLRHGNIDLSHYTILGPKSGIPNFMEYEIGKPVDVSINGRQTFVKAQLYQGESPMAKNANMVWDSLTRQSPPSRWYPSVGGSVLEKSVKLDPKTGDKIAVVSAVRWNNIALDRCPVNRTVPEVSTVPVGVFAKSLGGFVIAKALEASYATDAVGKVGGAAFGAQSLDQGVHSYFDFRHRISDALLKKRAKARSRDITTYAMNQLGLSADEAAEWVERFLRDLSRDTSKANKEKR
jgi:hypothetical protein